MHSTPMRDNAKLTTMQQHNTNVGRKTTQRKQRQRAENAARAKAAEDERTPLAAKRTSLHDQKNERQRELAQISKKVQLTPLTRCRGSHAYTCCGCALLGFQMAELTDAHDKAKRRLDRAKPRALAEGLEEVERYVAQNNIEGVRGTILDLIEVRDARCMTAVEVRPHCCVCVCVCASSRKRPA